MDFDRTYIIHHRDSDGYCAALAPWLHPKYRGATYIDVQYGEPFPKDLILDEKTEVYILDFSYDRKTLDDLNAKVGFLRVIDHHTTAEKALAGAEYAMYDNSKCGAELAWEYFYGYPPDSTLHMLVRDYDMFERKFKEAQWLENTMVIHEHRGNLFFWSQLLKEPSCLQQAINDGKGIQFYNDQTIKNILTGKTWTDKFWMGMKGAFINSSILRNEISEAILKAYPEYNFVAVYRILTNDRVKFSLRARKQDKHIDLNEISQRHNSLEHPGGGHRAACSFTLSMAEWAEITKKPGVVFSG